MMGPDSSKGSNECAVISALFQLALGALRMVAGRVVDIDSEKRVMSPIKVTFNVEGKA
jgi:hypothetical protein